MNRSVVVALVALLSNLGSASALHAQDVVLTNARIIVGNGTVIERGSIVIRGGKIASVGAPGENAVGLTAIDARGMSALPGFIDAHRHVNTGPNEQKEMQALLDAGYTTILSGGGPADGNLGPMILALTHRAFLVNPAAA